MNSARELLQEAWRQSYRDHRLCVQFAQAALDACAHAPHGLEASWARYHILSSELAFAPCTPRISDLRDVQRRFRVLGDRGGTVTAASMIAAATSQLGRPAAAWRTIVSQVEPALDELPPELQFACCTAAVVVALGMKDLLAGLRYAYRALDIARQLDDPSMVGLALFNLGYQHLNYGSFHEAIERFTEVLSLDEAHVLLNRRKTTPPSLIVAHVALGEFDKADALSARWMAEFSNEPIDNHVLYGRAMAIYLAARHPLRWSAAQADIETIEAEFARRRATDGIGALRLFRLHVALAYARLAYEQGQPAQAVDALLGAEPDADACEVSFIHAAARDELQRAYAAMGMWPQAHAALQDFARRQAEMLSTANVVQLHAISIMHTLDRERIARQKAEEATRLKGQFLANMSHEIRTPLNAILGMAHLAMRTPLPPKAHDYVDKIHHAGETLLGLVSDILDFSKIEAGKLDVAAEPFDLGALLSNVANMTSHAAAAKPLDYLFDIAPDVPRRLLGDAQRIGQVLVNLTNNAIKFTDAGGSIAVEVSTRQMPSPDTPAQADAPRAVHLEICVRDTGIGITQAQQAQLFEPFVQADGSTSRKYGGTGLGLSISRRLIELMGGHIKVRSAPGRGSTFEVQLSLVADTGEPERAVALPPWPAGAAAAPLLVVDAHRDRRAVIARTLRDWGGGLEVHSSADSALAWLHEHGPVAAVVAGGLRDSAAPLVEAAARSGGAACPCIFITHWGQEAPAGPGVDIVFEPFLPEDLRGTLARALRRHAGQPGASSVAAPSEEGAATRVVPGAAVVPRFPEGGRVLLAEDNAVNQLIACEMLRLTGLEVDVASDGQAAVERLLGASPDRYHLVLMDLQMPVLDGHGAAEAIRRDARFDALPIVALTAHTQHSVRERCKAQGMQDFLTKPIAPAALYRTLERWLTARAPL